MNNSRKISKDMKDIIKEKSLKVLPYLMTGTVIGLSGYYYASNTYGRNTLNHNSNVYYGDDNAKVKVSDIYALIKDNDIVLCYQDIVSSEYNIELTYAIYNNPVNMPYYENIYGYFSLEDNSLVTIEGQEQKEGFEVKRLDEILDYDEINEYIKLPVDIDELNTIVNTNKKVLKR